MTRRGEAVLPKAITYCIKTGHAEARGSVFDIEEEEDVYKPHDAIEGTPTPGTSADVWLL